MLNRYSKGVLELALKQPDKLRALYRMRHSIKDGIKNNYGKDVCSPPATIALKLTYRCNQECCYCKYWGENGVLPKSRKVGAGEMSTGQVKDVITEVSPYRPHLYISGGEPLLREDLPEIISHASDKGLVTRMASNSTLLEGK